VPPCVGRRAGQRSLFRVSLDLFWLVYLLRVPIAGLPPLSRQGPFHCRLSCTPYSRCPADDRTDCAFGADDVATPTGLMLRFLRFWMIDDNWPPAGLLRVLRTQKR
jgi:hypothetical protein